LTCEDAGRSASCQWLVHRAANSPPSASISRRTSPRHTTAWTCLLRNSPRRERPTRTRTRQRLTRYQKAVPVSCKPTTGRLAVPLTHLVTIFTPDTTHYPIALYAIERGIHVLITKPAVKLLEHHQELLSAAKKNNVFVYIEHHKRYDPAYADARFRAQKLGDFNYFYSYMSQPKCVLRLQLRGDSD
jgi:hypothetical protein